MANPDSTTPPTPAAPSGGRWVRVLLRGAASVLVVLVLLLAGVCWWATTQGSLPRVLQLAQRFLPQEQSLQFSDASGSIFGGGRIGRLQWSMPGTVLVIDELRLDWSLRELIGRALHVRAFEARSVHLRLEARPDEPPEEPFTMPSDLSLPIEVTLPLTVGRLQIDSVDADGNDNSHVVEDIEARYAFNGTQHALRLESLRYGASRLQADLHLYARELTLAAQVAASLRDLAPDTPFAMLAHLRAEGSLAGGDAAKMEVQLGAREQSHEEPPPDGARLLTELAALHTAFKDDAAVAQLQLQAAVHPWRQQPVQQLELKATHLDAHAFHAAAPHTELHGTASVRPVAGASASESAWDLALDFINDAVGGWDQQRLPVTSLVVQAGLTPERLSVRNAQVRLAGTSPAGTVIFTGEIPLQQLAQSTVRLELQQLNLQPLMAGLPRSAFNGTANVDPLPAQEGWQAKAEIRNDLPGPLDRDQAPLQRLLAELRITSRQWRAETLQMDVGTGRLQAQGSFDPEAGTLQVRSELQRLPLRQIHSRLATGMASVLSGTLTAEGDLRQGVDFAADIASNAAGVPGAGRRGSWEIRAVQTRGRWSPSRLTVEHLHADAFQARIDGSDVDVALPKLDSIKASLAATAPGMGFKADATMQARSGEGSLSLQVESAEQFVAWLRDLPIVGESLPALQASGSAQLQADWRGGWRQWMDGLEKPATHPQLQADAHVQADTLHLKVPAEQGDAAPMVVDVDRLAVNLQGNLAAANFSVDGDVSANDMHALLDVRLSTTQAAGEAGAPLWTATIDKFAVTATLPRQPEPWQLRMAEGLQVTAQTGEALALGTTAGHATLTPPRGVAPGNDVLELAWEPLQWRRAPDGTTRLKSRGTVRGIQPGWLDVLLAPTGEGPLAGAGISTDLIASGEWDIEMTDRLTVYAHLARDSGDLWLGEPETAPAGSGGADVERNMREVAQAAERVRREGVAAGIRTLDVKVQSEGEDISAALDWNTERAGVVTANLRTRLARQGGGWHLPQTAPVSGVVKANVENVGAWGFLAPPGWRVQGALTADISVDGTVEEPRLQGGIEASGLNIRSVLDGIDLHDGRLRATLAGQRLTIDELMLQGGTGSRAYVRGLSGNRTPPPTDRGSMTASGTIDWSGVAAADSGESGIAMDLSTRLEKMQVLVRNDRQLTLSGGLSAALQRGALRVRGDLAVDRASVMLPDAGAPTLGDDVVVVRASDPPPEQTAMVHGELQTKMPMDLEIRLDLGRDLALQGHGITTRLEGGLTVSSTTSGNDPFRVVGEVRTVEGRFRAWGQALNVETGVVRFNGPYANPSLNLLAIRPEIAVRAGVRVTGTLNAPRVQLYSEPEMPEAEKLSWVVLGRAAASSGAEGTSMQQAALGLLAGGVGSSLAGGLGLDEVGLGDSGVSIGKRISDELYLTYEAGLSGAASTLYVFYDITRRFTVRGQTGKAGAVDLIYTITYD